MNQICQERGHVPVQAAFTASAWMSVKDGSTKQLSDTKTVTVCDRCGEVLDGAKFKFVDSV
jgi:hypothetical protein